MGEVEIRSITLDDSGEVLTLQRAAYATEAQIYADPLLPALTQTLDDLRSELQRGSGLVATLDGRVVAAVRWTLDDDTIRIGRLVVAPDQQGRGLGTTLLRAAEGRTDATTAELFTGHLSTANLRLYLREGYVESRREPLRDGVDLVYLSKRLPQSPDLPSPNPPDPPAISRLQ